MLCERQLAGYRQIYLEEMGSACDVDKTKTPAFSEFVNLIVDSCRLPMPKIIKPCDDGPIKLEYEFCPLNQDYAKLCEEFKIPTEVPVFLRNNNQKLPFCLVECFRNVIRFGKAQSYRGSTPGRNETCNVLAGR